jgi:uncharacterized protein YdeI (YjbR/CyaY-like superfamily)
MTGHKKDLFERFTPQSRQDWRNWLQANHDKAKGVWLVFFKKHSGQAKLTYSDAVEEALCFGWIDNRPNKLDEERYLQQFSPRQPKSTWAKSNKIRVEKLIAQGLMTEAGLKVIEQAKKDGSWDSLNEIDELILPPDLQAALDSHPTASQYFGALSTSLKKGILWWMASAHRPETREKRIHEIITSLHAGQDPLYKRPINLAKV